MAASKTPNGTAEAPIEVSTLPPVVGINFGNSYASIAVFTKEGHAECIANEDGERQIACALAFHGEEMYIGNQAKPQLVKNAKNTIVGFRNILGKKFSEISQPELSTSAPVIQHPDQPDEPAYKVEVLKAAAPAPSAPKTASNTPAASALATPASEPVLGERILTVSEVATIFIRSLIQSAEDFMGKKVQGAVITVPTWFTEAQQKALEKAATDAGVNVLQLLDEAAATVPTTTSESWGSGQLSPDRTQLVVDVGHSSLSLNLLSIRDGLAHVIASSSSTTIGAAQIDAALIKFFAADFTKKTKTALAVAPAPSTQDARAEAKLLLAIEHTKRTLSASPGAATCSVESLKDGLDYTGTVNRLRFDMLAKPTYQAVATEVTALLAAAAVDPVLVDEIVYVGGTGSLPGLDEHLVLAAGFRESVATPFSLGTVVGGGEGDPTTVLARGCALQAELIAVLGEEDAELRHLFTDAAKLRDVQDVPATSAALGVVFPDAAKTGEPMDGLWVPVIAKETPLPARRAVTFEVEVESEESSKFAFEVAEASVEIKVELQKPPKDEYDEYEEDEEPEDIEVKQEVLKKDRVLGVVEFEAKKAIKILGSGPKAGKWTTTVDVKFVVGIDGALTVTLAEHGNEDVKTATFN
ncbi:actin-like ATPase domain-containing protein [Schizophyllum commune H4-8]|uniref:Actin-like ATPase domain-containing protein n=1 Tax=Schizophyllum commune (strain H4-8 / FGSC 9210) TaxID=578458 RepID=D8QKB3_SCHCM|nr:actin-like ATPase domain-containing protein [Schizophyllum commune H4-8]KAI5885042.1 actin-like ATPase domain-containing protein [Schizophyllum commune H4-8]